MHPLEVLISLRRDRPEAGPQIREQLARGEVFALGQPAGDTSNPGHGTESDLLHYSNDVAGGGEEVLLPVFTRPEMMREALMENPDWQTQMVLKLDGRDLLDHVDDDVTVIINPWTKSEYRLERDAGAA
jgi:hypothetical protein